MLKKSIMTSAILLALFGVAACGGGGGSDDGTPESNGTGQSNGSGGNEPPVALTTYSFERDGTSTVSYSGQTARHVLISELNSYIGNQLAVDAQTTAMSEKEEFVATLMSFYDISETDYDTIVGDRQLTLTTSPGSEQLSLRQISSSHKDLDGKIAGNDATGQHKDWNNGALVGWGAQGSFSPDGLVKEWFDMLADNAVAIAAGTDNRVDPAGNPIEAVYLTESGLDLKQLVQKFLLGAVAYSQGTDDYLDDDIDGKGLLTANTLAEGKSYTSLEHTYDEGFGYFGAARNYLAYTDDEIAAKGGREAYASGYNDANGDGAIDLTAEYNFGNSVNAAKRDRGTAANTNPTDFTSKAFNAFLAGRQIIADANQQPLTDEQLADLQAQRDIAVEYWEKSVASTIVHYINDVSADLAQLGTEGFSFADMAKHWSEMKGFALGLQFNPHSPLTDADFANLHGFLGDAPELDVDAVDGYLSDLQLARDLLQDRYGFDAENVANW